MTSTTNDTVLRQAEIAAAACSTIDEMRTMIATCHEAIDDMENMIDLIESAGADRMRADELRLRVEQQRNELELFKKLVVTYEQGQLNKRARAAFARLLCLPTSH